MSSIEKAVERLRGIQGGERNSPAESPKHEDGPVAETVSPNESRTRETNVDRSMCHIDLEHLERLGFVTPLSHGYLKGL